MHDKRRERLLTILQTRSVAYGDFTLASGARSNHYFDCKLTTLDPEAAWLVGAIFADIVHGEEQRRGVTIQGIGGLTMGSDPIALATGMVVRHQAPERPLKVFSVRKSPKAYGQNKLIEGNFTRGDRVVVIDDVVTRGESTLTAIRAIREAGGIVELAAVLVDREEGGRLKIEAEGLSVVSVFRKSEILKPT